MRSPNAGDRDALVCAQRAVDAWRETARVSAPRVPCVSFRVHCVDHEETLGGATTTVAPRYARFVQSATLRVLEGPDAGRTFAWSGASGVVGKHESADYVLSDNAVSRFHCEITTTASHAVVVDLQSRNGLLVDGVAVRRARLRAGAVLTIGRTKLRFEPAGEAPAPTRAGFGGLVGRSPAMVRVLETLEAAAASAATVLVDGETGTGKEAVARALHDASDRAKGPFVVVDCAALPPNLLESELFGHERGAFTGADAAREGAFEAANGGTVFLDEIGELGAELQPKLLRVLERRQIKRVGRARHVAIDVRVVAATNRDLRAEVNAGRFRADLFFRLAVLQVRLPPLRERAGDLPALVDRFLSELHASDEVAALVRAPAVLAELERHTWPGNVRELRNYVERCAALRMRPASVADAPLESVVDASLDLATARDAFIRPHERRYLISLLAANDGNVSSAARSAGVARSHFYRLLWRHGLAWEE